MKTLLKSEVNKFLQTLSSDANVFVPAKDNDTSKFALYVDGQVEVMLDDNTLLPPKTVLFPQVEGMYKFKAKGTNLEIEEIAAQKDQQIIFAARACDVKSFDCLDQVFLTKGFVDTMYEEKRNRTTVIALACNSAKNSCFCTSMGLDPQKAEGADIQAYDLGDKLAFEAKTDKGAALLAKAGMLKEEDAKLPKAPEFKLQVSTEGLADKLKDMFEHPIWNEFMFKCLGCGTCAYICPTCHCFDITNRLKGEDGVKIRTWDTCMFNEYTLMAGGHQPRAGKKERVRNRFLHKLRYFPERYNMSLCTGCGRCVAKCPANVDITKFIEKANQA